MPWHLKSEGGQVLVVRNRDKKVVGRHANRKKATAQLKVLYSLEKSQFWALIEKASFNGDRSAAGRYAAQQRWKGHVKDATKPVVRERMMAEKFRNGPILKNGYDNFGFPILITPDEAKARFGDTVTMQKAYFGSRGIDLLLGAKSDQSLKVDTESRAYFAVLQALDDVLDQVDTSKLVADPKNGLLPRVYISDKYDNEETTGGYYASYSNEVAVFMNTAELIEKSYADGKPYNSTTVPQLTADAIKDGLFGGDSISARVAYGFTVHELGHWIDHSLGNTADGSSGGYWSDTIREKVFRDPANASDGEKLFGTSFTTNMSSAGTRGSQYSNTAPVERFAENFVAWFTLTKVNELRTNELKIGLAAQGGFLAVGAALEVLKQGQIVDNVLNWRPDHPVFLFAFRGEPFDVDAFRQQLLVGMIKASFAGDRSAAGRYAAEQRWKGHVKDATTSAQARDRTQELQPYFGRTKAEYQVSKGRKDIDKKLNDKQSKGTGIGDLQLEVIADMQGFSGLPKVVSSEEMDRLQKEGWTIAYRGIADSYFDDMIEFRAVKLAEQFRTGEYFAGQGMYGNGIYFALDEKTAREFAGNDGEVIKVAIPPNALMGRKDFETEVSSHRNMFRSGHRNGNFEEVGFHGISDIGRALTAKGVRGVETNTLSSGSFSMDVSTTGETPNVVIIWDRSMLAVEESTKTK